MLRIFFVLILSLMTMTFSFAKEDELEPRFRQYQWNPNIYGGPRQETIKANNETAIIYSPLIDNATLKIKPRPQKIIEALNHPGKFFQKDADRAVLGFRKFSKEYKDCIDKNKWPEKFECLKRIDICFGVDEDRYTCSWGSHEKISKCVDRAYDGSIGLINCFKKSEKAFDLFNKCFDEKARIRLLFEIYGNEALRRDYYTLDSYFFTHELKGTRCRFTVMNGNEYRLVDLSSHGYGRPELSMAPMDIYVKDHYLDLLEYQQQTKAGEQAEKLKEKRKEK